MSSLTLYNYDLDDSCYRVRLLLSLLGLKYETIAVDMQPGREQEQPQMLAISPPGTLPILSDGDLTLSGTEAILSYLARAYDPSGQWLPLDATRYGLLQQWLGFAGRQMSAAVIARQQALFTPDGAKPQIVSDARHALRIVEDHMTLQQIAGLEFVIADHPTIADVALIASFALSRDFGLDHDAFPALRRWLRRMRKLDGFITMPGIPDYH